ncbi:MAG: T9SS type A sorting domain-containing protein [Chitinophagaceae bacterium]|nr:T9SS type A sorting domain-containing protein [Chitinophagaceae bacterium]
MGLFIQFSGYSQERYPVSARDLPVKILKFYPNPATTYINFDFQKDYNRSYNLVIYNFLGKKVFEISVVNSSNQIDLSDFPRGVYIFQLRNKDGRIIESGKFQVSK